MVTKVPDRQRTSGHQDASAKITATLAGLDFPLTKEALAERVGDKTVEIEDGKEIAIRDMLKHVQRESFKSFSAAQNALDRHWRAYRADLGLEDAVPERITRPGGGTMAAQYEHP